MPVERIHKASQFNFAVLHNLTLISLDGWTPDEYLIFMFSFPGQYFKSITMIEGRLHILITISSLAIHFVGLIMTHMILDFVVKHCLISQKA